MSTDRKTWEALATALKTTTKSIRAWRRLPGAPKGHDIESWNAFIEENGLGEVGNRVSQDREHWLTQQAEYRAKLLEIEHKKALGEIVLKADLDARDVRVAAAQKAALYEILTTELPVKSEGKSAVEIRVLNREAADRVCVIMQERLNDWATATDEEQP
jgi:hypothetical protein